MPDLMLSRYRVVRRVGAGGMGEVFLAEDTELERPVALKVMSAASAQDPIQRKRFRAEARAASSLSHPNICVIYEVGETAEGRPFIALEFVEGQTLERVRQHRRFTLREIVELGIQMANALETAHAHRVVHRDIKPANLMIDRRGQVKVMDFGLAKQTVLDPTTVEGASSLLSTQSGVLVGTPHYMSPEQALGREVDHRTDLFSLGVVLYELVAGQKPFPGGTVGEAINAVVNRPADPLRRLNPQCPAALERIVLRCLEKEPALRYATAQELARDLRALQEGALDEPSAVPDPRAPAVPAPAGEAQAGRRLPWPKRPDHGSPAQRRRRAVGVAVGMAVLILGAAAVVWWGLRPGSRNAPGTPLAGPQSIAVLPFDNFSGEPDTDYLSDGLTEEITAALSRVPGLRVVSRNSAYVFKGKKEDVRRIGASLKVTSLLEGSVRKTGRQLRVTAQLISAKDGFHLWSETYDRSLDDVLIVQQDIAGRIAERLQGNRGGLALRPAVNPEAHRLYLQARVFWNKRSGPGLERAIQLFQQAIDREPAYAAAHAGLAASYLVLPMYSPQAKPGACWPPARAAALRALELDTACAEAHAVLGNLAEAAHDSRAAEEHLQRAIRVDPNYATAHHWYGRYLNLHDRREEGWRELQTALDLDPFSPVINTTIPEWHYMGGDYPRAIDEARGVIERFPDFQIVRKILIGALLMNGQLAEALAEIEQARKLQPEEPSALLGFQAYALARSGQEAQARKILALLEQGHQAGKPVGPELSVAYYGLREYDRVFDLTEVAAAEGGLDRSLLIDPFGAELRRLPRFQELLKRFKLEP